jgi:hypothetical protein
VVDLVTTAEKDIIAGKLHPFQGPLKDNTGKERVPAGKTMSDDQLQKMDFYVAGVQGSLPKKSFARSVPANAGTECLSDKDADVRAPTRGPGALRQRRWVPRFRGGRRSPWMPTSSTGSTCSRAGCT